MDLMAGHWGVWCSAGMVCYCVIVTLRDVRVRLFKYFHKESPFLSGPASTSHLVGNHVPIVKCIFTYTKCHMSDDMEANLSVAAHSKFQSSAEVKQAKPHSRSDIENCALIEGKAKQRDSLYCLKLCLI